MINKLYKNIEELRKNINIYKYKELKEKNKNDIFYSWAFKNDCVIYETIEELKENYQDNYIIDILNTYIEILNNCKGDQE